MRIEPANGMGAFGKNKIKIAQKPNLVRTYKLRNHIGRLMHNKIPV
jgi:hypothetical protein